MRKENESRRHWLLAALRKYFFAGLVVIVPIAAAILALIWIFNSIDNILQPVIRDIITWFDPGYTREKIIGLGFVITILLIFITGMIASNYVGHKLIKFGESMLARVPIFRQIYAAIKQVVDAISGANFNKAAFRKVVFVEFPLKGMKTIAFVTNEQVDPRGNKLYSIYIPTSPTPTSGYYMIATTDKVVLSDITVDMAMKMVISGGIISPPVIEVGVPEPPPGQMK
jgi:uncharacterized membrane protein